MPISGSQQSPIRIEKAKTFWVDFGRDYIHIGYTGPLYGVYKGDNFVFDDPQDPTGKTITIGNVTWVIRKIHIHNPAEHLFEDNEPAAYECHLVHSWENDPKARQAKLVIGVFFHLDEKAPSKPTIRELSEKLRGAKEKADSKEPCDIPYPHPIDPREFLPDESHLRNWFRYEGSLTSEPFSEDVSWFVMQTEMGIQPSEIDEIGRCAKQTARAVYPLDRRFVLRSFE